ncbi:MAG: 5-(carboxyamino)imidazole ribonucleotide mutase [Zetaproteobacteria bacterium]|nr:MAG: 5-(carboxyamino)imidazole ribonucleotide mutase [Zetaproteobacteria bacterium]
MKNIKVLILIGSKSDMSIMEQTSAVLDQYDVPHKVLVRSAHRTPEATIKAVHDAEAVGCGVFICAAGMAAHLAGVVASKTILPVIGVPISAGPLQGQDALLSTVMMPPGIPVACVGVNAAKNAGILAVQILAQSNTSLADKLRAAREAIAQPED